MSLIDQNIPIFESLVERYGLKPATVRDLPLLTFTCVVEGYGLMEKYFGISYEAIAALGLAGKFHSMLNENDIAEKTRHLIQASPNLEQSILEPGQNLFEKFKKELELSKNLVLENPQQFIKKLTKIYPDYCACIGIYNCFWRYIGDGQNIVLSQEQVSVISRQREAVAKVYPDVEKLLMVAVEVFGKEYGFDGDLLRYLTLHELQDREDLVLSSIEIDQLTRRRENYFYLYEYDSHRELLTTEAGTLETIQQKYFTVSEARIISELYGTSAFVGKVKGRVVNLAEEKVSEDTLGEDTILVTVMTHPSDISLIKKSKALVTDEGGVLCHAAIVAREFEIPCVIGTKIATKIFRNGDMVEVDATVGVVKKI